MNTFGLWLICISAFIGGYVCGHLDANQSACTPAHFMRVEQV